MASQILATLGALGSTLPLNQLPHLTPETALALFGQMMTASVSKAAITIPSIAIFLLMGSKLSSSASELNAAEQTIIRFPR